MRFQAFPRCGEKSPDAVDNIPALVVEKARTMTHFCFLNLLSCLARFMKNPLDGLAVEKPASTDSWGQHTWHIVQSHEFLAGRSFW